MFNFSIVTPEKKFLEGKTVSLILPGSEGYLGILTDHAPLMTALVPGKVTIKDETGHEISIAISYGFVEVSANCATLLVDSAEFVSDIEVERARKALDRAKKRLADKAGDIDIPRAEKALARARNRIRLAAVSAK